MITVSVETVSLSKSLYQLRGAGMALGLVSSGLFFFVAGKGSEGATCDTFSNQGRMRICSAHWQISNLSNYFTIKDMLS